MRQELDLPFGRIRILDSIAELCPADRDQIVVCGSHGGLSAADYAQQNPPRIVVFNDAGVGKQKAGIAALAVLDGIGVIAATVSHDTACIGDGMDTWRSGRLSHLNTRAQAAGLRAGDMVTEAVERSQRLANYRLCRLDDNGNRFVMLRHLTYPQANSERMRYEALGHKQSYWIEAEADVTGAQREQ
ncbi:MAG TPA: hypothetical protein PK620_03475 [Denitromonas sp.]|uniref:hypothetical protein n=1 Tax=Denitromonas sp. TaxID=2734609 RepID=UPI001DE5B5F3|nr:hypothetical protein [Rhodocyclaceae bacterium]HPR06025.1 hypothetical protein [Denitromonas sp.]HQU87667.1 hypothetical protein [Denitromonas sp.]HQV13954.1 hypothetical protein [Denitromonas sp.]